MALIQLGGGVTDARGSIGGTCFSRSKSGNYIRARHKPVNPCAQQQEKRRGVLSALAALWGSLLDPTQRQGWIDYANTCNWTNGLGQAITVPGISAFVRTNAIRRMLALALAEARPTGDEFAGALGFTFTLTTATQKVNIATIDPPWDAATDDDYAIFFMGLPNPPGRLATPKRWGFMAAIEGDSVTPIVLPVAMDAAYAFTEGQNISVASLHLDPLNRVSGRIYQQLVAPS